VNAAAKAADEKHRDRGSTEKQMLRAAQPGVNAGPNVRTGHEWPSFGLFRRRDPSSDSERVFGRFHPENDALNRREITTHETLYTVEEVFDR